MVPCSTKPPAVDVRVTAEKAAYADSTYCCLEYYHTRDDTPFWMRFRAISSITYLKGTNVRKWCIFRKISRGRGCIDVFVTLGIYPPAPAQLRTESDWQFVLLIEGVCCLRVTAGVPCDLVGCPSRRYTIYYNHFSCAFFKSLRVHTR